MVVNIFCVKKAVGPDSSTEGLTLRGGNSLCDSNVKNCSNCKMKWYNGSLRC